MSDAPDYEHVFTLGAAMTDAPDWQETAVGPGGVPIGGGALADDGNSIGGPVDFTNATVSEGLFQAPVNTGLVTIVGFAVVTCAAGGQVSMTLQPGPGVGGFNPTDTFTWAPGAAVAGAIVTMALTVIIEGPADGSGTFTVDLTSSGVISAVLTVEGGYGALGVGTLYLS